MNPGPISTPLNFTQAQETMSEKKPRLKLDKAGTAILEDYVLKHPDDMYPPTAIRKSLLEQVQRAQNNSDIKIRTIESWFRRRRSKAQAAPAQHPGVPLTPTSLASPSTSFSEESLRLLHTLVQTTSDPPPDVLDVWASLFHVSRPALQYAMTIVLPDKFSPLQTQGTSRDQAQSGVSSCSTETNRITHPQSMYSKQLPTPSDSLTPEPILRNHHSDTGSPDLCKDEITSPTLEYCLLVDGAPQRSIQPVESPDDQQGHVQLSPPLTPIVPTTRVSPRMPASTQLKPHDLSVTSQTSPFARVICSGVLVACLNTVVNTGQSRPLPKTNAESDVRFAPYQKNLEKLSCIFNHPPESASYLRR